MINKKEIALKIVYINACNYGSTGTIMRQTAMLAENLGHQTWVCVPKSRSNLKKAQKSDVLIGSILSRVIHNFLARFTGFSECFSILSTWRFLHKLKKICPDIIHLHNLHGRYVNLSALFHYIKKYNIRVIWTLHDCWAFTGQCAHFTMAKCDKWKNGCHDCTQLRAYPMSFVDRTKSMWKLKRKWFTGIQNITIVTPSQWLADLVKESYLKEYPVKVINNGIDLSIFKPTKSDFRQKHGIGEKYMLLGVADSWGIQKGLDVFVKLSKRLNPTKYQIVLVGTNDDVDKQLPKNIISIHRTQNQKQLAKIYTAADLFVNPTREDVFGLVNVEALACGTPVVTFNTGGSPECRDESCGSVVEWDNVDMLESQIIWISQNRPFSSEMCMHRAERFNKNEKYKEYVGLYEQIEDNF